MRQLIAEYTKAGDLILDPFVGSGTLLVEAIAADRRAAGADVDPLSVLLSRVKATALDPQQLEERWRLLIPRLEELRRSPDEYRRLMHEDVDDETFSLVAPTLDLPAIPNLSHWFRRYVLEDLAAIRQAFAAASMTGAERDFFRVCFGATIRNVSNADPVPVSGLEVTRYIKERDAQGRLIDPFAQLERAVSRGIAGMREYFAASNGGRPESVRRVSVTRLSSVLRGPYSAIITSPPYHGAVDYYRRHQLEMFWLGLTRDQAERLRLLSDYIGRPWPPSRHPWVRGGVNEPLAVETERRIRTVHPRRADAFHHYAVAMQRGLRQMSVVLRPGGKAILVVGHSTWADAELDTTDLFAALAPRELAHVETLSYPVKNRYMSYKRHNGANIDQEYVLIFRRGAE